MKPIKKRDQHGNPHWTIDRGSGSAEPAEEPASSPAAEPASGTAPESAASGTGSLPLAERAAGERDRLSAALMEIAEAAGLQIKDDGIPWSDDALRLVRVRAKAEMVRAARDRGRSDVHWVRAALQLREALGFETMPIPTNPGPAFLDALRERVSVLEAAAQPALEIDHMAARLSEWSKNAARLAERMGKDAPEGSGPGVLVYLGNVYKQQMDDALGVSGPGRLGQEFDEMSRLLTRWEAGARDLARRLGIDIPGVPGGVRDGIPDPSILDKFTERVPMGDIVVNTRRRLDEAERKISDWEAGALGLARRVGLETQTAEPTILDRVQQRLAFVTDEEMEGLRKSEAELVSAKSLLRAWEIHSERLLEAVHLDFRGGFEEWVPVPTVLEHVRGRVESLWEAGKRLEAVSKELRDTKGDAASFGISLGAWREEARQLFERLGEPFAEEETPHAGCLTRLPYPEEADGDKRAEHLMRTLQTWRSATETLAERIGVSIEWEGSIPDPRVLDHLTRAIPSADEIEEANEVAGWLREIAEEAGVKVCDDLGAVRARTYEAIRGLRLVEDDEAAETIGDLQRALENREKSIEAIGRRIGVLTEGRTVSEIRDALIDLPAGVLEALEVARSEREAMTEACRTRDGWIAEIALHVGVRAEDRHPADLRDAILALPSGYILGAGTSTALTEDTPAGWLLREVWAIDDRGEPPRYTPVFAARGGMDAVLRAEIDRALEDIRLAQIDEEAGCRIVVRLLATLGARLHDRPPQPMASPAFRSPSLEAVGIDPGALGEIKSQIADAVGRLAGVAGVAQTGGGDGTDQGR